MSAVFDFIDGDTPVVVSIPHDGRELAPGMAERMTDAGRALPDTDWHVRRLYGFAEELGATVIAANYSRYVVDLNRSADDAALYPGQVSTGLCPLETFAGEPIYTGDAALSDAERQARVETYWRPYHDRLQQALARIADRYGYALLWDAHSIRAEVPLLFDGRLPDLNIGTNGGASCRDDLSKAAGGVAAASGYSSVINGRFKGGFITRHYGDPGRGVHAIQLEIAQRTYMDEASFEYLPPAAERLRALIAPMLEAFLSSAADAFRAQDSA
jgi:N-formylglutamate amidohydrolase